MLNTALVLGGFLEDVAIVRRIILKRTLKTGQ
jgi:hypothetical protein